MQRGCDRVAKGGQGCKGGVTGLQRGARVVSCDGWVVTSFCRGLVKLPDVIYLQTASHEKKATIAGWRFG